MSMGTCCHYADCVGEKALEKIAGKEALDAFKDAFEKYPYQDWEISDGEELANTVCGYNPGEIDQDSDAYKELAKKWKAVAGPVKKATGLKLYCDYHEPEDAYDEVDGLFFYFETHALYKPSDELLALRKKFGKDVVERCFWSTFG